LVASAEDVKDCKAVTVIATNILTGTFQVSYQDQKSSSTFLF